MEESAVSAAATAMCHHGKRSVAVVASKEARTGQHRQEQQAESCWKQAHQYMKDSGKDGGAAEAGKRAVGSMVTSAAAAASRIAQLCSVAKNGTGRKERTQQNKENQSEQRHECAPGAATCAAVGARSAAIGCRQLQRGAAACKGERGDASAQQLVTGRF